MRFCPFYSVYYDINCSIHICFVVTRNARVLYWHKGTIIQFKALNYMSSMLRTRKSARISKSPYSRQPPPTPRDAGTQTAPDVPPHHNQVNPHMIADVQPAGTADQNNIVVDLQQPTIATSSSATESAGTSSTPNFEDFVPNSLVSVADDLGAHVPLSLREKIWAKEYVDLAKLLNSDPKDDQQHRVNIINGQLIIEPKSHDKKINSIEVWSNAFIIYMNIYIVKHPIETQDMLKYMKSLRLGESRNPSSNWKDYDIQFRLRKARNMSLGWGVIDSELCKMYMCQSQSSSLTVPSQQMIQKCYDFNYRGSCTKQGCRYSHTWIKCNKNHALYQCWFRNELQLKLVNSNFTRISG